MFEIRYRGELLSTHETERDAKAHAQKHYTGEHLPIGAEGGVRLQDPEALVIAPAKPVLLFVRGTFVDSFAAKEHVTKDENLKDKDWLIVERGEDVAEACAKKWPSFDGAELDPGEPVWLDPDRRPL
jgi:hypothetical protein